MIKILYNQCMDYQSWTPYSEVNAALQRILQASQQALQNNFVGMILHGSLTSGDFDPHRSDVDFLVVTMQPVTADQLDHLANAFEQLTHSSLPWSTNVEGSFIPLDALRRYDPPNIYHPALRCDGSFGVDGHGTDWILQRWNIREYGRALVGPEPKTLIDPISADDMRKASAGILRGWWQPMLEDDFRLEDAEYQAYAVMTMCRSFYTLKTAEVASKPTAARYALSVLDPRWLPLIEEAMQWRHGMKMDRKELVKDFIRFTLDFCTEIVDRG